MLFTGKCDVSISEYNPGKSVKITITGPSGKEVSLFTSTKAYERFNGEVAVVKKIVKTSTAKTVKTTEKIDKPATKKELESELKKLMAQLKK